ncbi:hypothetical protein J4463_02700 [Candidatus Pacearchaeota archaeon]|nr:hypothetical protein [Candidatus Pacearchaeota archaeon]
MKIEDVQVRENKDIIITVRTTRQNSEWLKKNRISPSLMFDKAIEELQQKIAEEGLKKVATWKGR